MNYHDKSVVIFGEIKGIKDLKYGNAEIQKSLDKIADLGIHVYLSVFDIGVAAYFYRRDYLNVTVLCFSCDKVDCVGGKIPATQYYSEYGFKTQLFSSNEDYKACLQSANWALLINKDKPMFYNDPNWRYDYSDLVKRWIEEGYTEKQIKRLKFQPTRSNPWREAEAAAIREIYS